MNKIILMAKNTQLYTNLRVIEECSRLGIDLEVINPFDSMIQIPEKKANSLEKSLEKRGGIIFHRVGGIQGDDYDLEFSRFTAQESNCQVLNPLYCLSLLRDKTRMSIELAKLAIEQIPTVFFRGKLTNEKWEKLKQLLGPYTIDDRYIIKLSRGGQGIGVNLVRGKDSLFSFLETFWAIRDQKLIVQPYLFPREELRLFYLGGKIISAIKRFPQEENFKANYHQGGKAILLKEEEIPIELIKKTNIVCDSFKLWYGSVEFILYNGTWYLLEINSIPGLKQLEGLMQENLAGMLINKAFRVFN